ncbi:MAG: hypothetical protein VYD64_00485, partial [Pseudomonadota bacterium]|nr:hypothetical protein [Pseudomonadota bacterium]
AGPFVAVQGHGAGNDAIPGRDGRADPILILEDARLAPGSRVSASVRVHLLATPGTLAVRPRAWASARQLPGRIETPPPAGPVDAGETSGSAARQDPAAAKRVVFGPVAEPQGQALVTYRLGVRAGEMRIDGLVLRDDLNAALGPGTYQVVDLSIVSKPREFGANANPFFNGSDDRDLLTSGASLEGGEHVALDLTLRVAAAGGSRVNTVAAGDAAPAGRLTEASVETLFPAAEPGDLPTIGLTADRSGFGPGERIAFRLVPGDAATGNRPDYLVRLPKGLSYLAGTGRVGTQRREPVSDGGWLAWSDIETGVAGAAVAFDAAADPDPGEGRFVVTGFARDPVSGALASRPASVTLRRDSDAVYDCTGIAGAIFEDVNRDGFRQAGEPGIAGVWLDLEGELSVTSGRDGSYAFACAAIGRERMGGLAGIELMQASLPAGLKPTTPVSQRVALRRGRVARAEFGVARLPVTAFPIGDAAFEPGSLQLREEALQSLARLMQRLERAPSVLRIVHEGEAESGLAARRLEAVRALADKAWRAGERS